MKSKAIALWAFVTLFAVTLVLMHKLNTLQDAYWTLDAEHQALQVEYNIREEKIVKFFIAIQSTFNYWKENRNEQK